VSVAPILLQMVRAHYTHDDAAFSSAAAQLARRANDKGIQHQINEIVRRGQLSRPGRPSKPGDNGFKQLPPRPPSTVAGGLLQSLEPVSFPELVLEPDVQDVLDELAEELEYREELKARKLRPRNRLLFHGPPGNGKTASATALATQLGLPAYGVSLPDLIGSHIGETGGNLGKIFDSIGPDTVVVFDEIDAIGTSRGAASSGADKEHNSTVNTFLTLLDRNRHGVIVATTNRPELIDTALLRRFDEKVFFPAPGRRQLESLAVKLCEKYEVELQDVSGCENFDAAAKHIETAARRIVMAEIRAAGAASEEANGEEEAAN